jgi:uncharacterized membrane protein YphA (DoxX/SURF4 family)
MVQHSLPQAYWSLPKRIVFRFLFLYGLVYMLPFLRGLVELVVPWVAQQFFRVTIIDQSSGSGDRLVYYLLIVCMFVLALIGTLLWSWLDRQRPNYVTLGKWLWLIARYWLAAYMLIYGMMKVLPLQFGTLPTARLLQPLGDFSPMGLLWTFMSFSRSYTLFTGWIEVLGGALLIFRRTTLLGALICSAAMLNVVILNLSYDVPVKQFSIHLLLAALLILWPERQRLINIFLLDRATTSSPIPPLIAHPTLQRWGSGMTLATTGLILTATLILSVINPLDTVAQPRPSIAGMWRVEEFRFEGASLPPLTTNPWRWQRFVIDNSSRASLQLMDGTVRSYVLQLNEPSKSISLSRGGNPSSRGTFTYQQPRVDTLTIEGELDNRRVEVVLHAEDLEDFTLTSRGFHWVTEVPFNR